MSLPLNKRKIIIDDEIYRVLREGEMPSVEDILRTLTSLANVTRTMNPAQAPERILELEVLRSELWNNLVAEMEIDLRAMRATLDETWNELEAAAYEILSTSPNMRRQANHIENVSIRALALSPLAGGVSVRREPIAVSGGITFANLDNADMKLSKDVEINLEAGAVAIKKSASCMITAEASSSFSTGGEYTANLDRTIGSPLWTTDGDLARTFTAVLSTAREYGEVWVEMNYSLVSGDDTVKTMNGVDVVCPSGERFTVSVWIEAESPGNWTFYGNGSGSTRVRVQGGKVHARNSRVRISKFKADDIHYHGSRLAHDYNFQIGEVLFMDSTYAAEGDIISDPISLGGAPVASLVCDIDADIPDTSIVNLYVARDEKVASTMSDFRWVPVSSLSGLAQVSKLYEDMTYIHAKHPTKITSGAGSFSNDIWAIGIVDGSLTWIDEGVDQLEVQSITVDWNSTSMSASGWENVSVAGVMNRVGDTLSGGNYFRLTTKVYSDTATSGVLPISFDEATVPDGTKVISDYIVTLNNVDITERVKAGSDSVGYVAGENRLEIIIKAIGLSNIPGYPTSTTIELQDIAGKQILIDRPDIVSEMSLGGSIRRAAQRSSDGAVLLNHDVRNRAFRVYARKSSGQTAIDVRVRAQMLRGTNGSSPQIRAIYVTTGV